MGLVPLVCISEKRTAKKAVRFLCSFSCKKSDELGGIYNVLVHQDFDQIDQCKNGTDAAQEGHDDLEDTLLGLAHNKVVDTEVTNEETNESDNPLALASEGVIGIEKILFNCNPAADADSCIGINGLAAILAESVAVAGFNATVQANGLIVIHFLTAVFAEHKYLPRFA